MRSHPFPGLHDVSNLICVCGTGVTGCHGLIHKYQTWAYENGWLVKGTSDLILPVDTPIMVHGRGLVYLDDSGHYLKEIEVAA
jgi:hypothetical protein